MVNIKVGYVILHYNEFDSTLKSVFSILNSNDKDIFIVIVDNNSPDKSGYRLKAFFEKENIIPNLKVILNPTNLGFSKGNNIGVNHLRAHFKVDFICVLNNDIYLNNKNFDKEISDSYNKQKFHILGPDIIDLKSKMHINPVKLISSLKEAESTLEYFKKSQKFLFTYFSFMYYLFNKYSRIKFPPSGIGLHGSILIFSKDYLNSYSEVFPEYTFMYGEENFLFFRKVIDNIVLRYDPALKVLHDHSKSTNANFKKKIDKWRFQNNLIQTSLKILINLYKNL